MNYIDSGKRTIEIERDAVNALLERIDSSFEKACELMLQCSGRIVVTGMGKSGHIANKIAATLASTGTPAFFVHPGEASHGDLGMITKQDVVLAISNSGQTEEVVTILPLIKRMGAPLISMTGKQSSALATASDVSLDISISKEACPLGLAPTSSTTVTLALGDALAVALLEARGFSEEDFAFSHPGGSLGRKLLLTVEQLMHTGDRIPEVSPATPLTEGLFEISDKGFGLTAIVNDANEIQGLFTDGDLRRAFDDKLDLHNTEISKVMTKNCKTIQSKALAAEALQVMEEYKITGLLVSDEENKLVGVIHMHDLLKAGVV
ncbi:D-arabinose 5-phosphate isomerase [Oleiphilus sp. HI0009]|uniref:KpsF/GutQ family sugar-phosphate isomerase n=2 Tax=Oleiphilus TaxID=141450 RepID=UPI0007C278BF|nr:MULTISPECIES: KpsF/GutQ family sugar-phosphate isomerase [unclassified Oleiphilus]KZX82757.1 D-arabinose 5-phosphate isomerase [Oleiphilus sp. HI0009]KZY65453.1 D-arabinose 5-phosphate isomerase [Oleiphilus sp. HI0066]KZY69178.1 D-arabinose 5-phosphate isomerase [Oleiphilus sp. HI0067]